MIKTIAEGQQTVTNKTFTVTLDDVIALANDGSVFGEPRPVLVVDPVTGRVYVDWQIPPHWGEALPGQWGTLDRDAVARELTSVHNSVLIDPGLTEARITLGAQAAWYAEQPSMPTEIASLFRGLAERLIEAGLSDSYAKE